MTTSPITTFPITSDAMTHESTTNASSRLSWTPGLAAVIAVLPVAYPIAVLVQDARDLAGGTTLLDRAPDLTGAAVMVVLAALLCLVPLMVGRAVARRSQGYLVAAGVTGLVVALGYGLQCGITG